MKGVCTLAAFCAMAAESVLPFFPHWSRVRLAATCIAAVGVLAFGGQVHFGRTKTSSAGRVPKDSGFGRRPKKVHVILDNLSTHKTAAVKLWLAAHPNVQLHFTPTYSSWLNQVEVWLGNDYPRLHPPGSVPLRAGPEPENHDLHSQLQPPCPALPLDLSQPPKENPCVTYFSYGTLVRGVFLSGSNLNALILPRNFHSPVLRGVEWAKYRPASHRRIAEFIDKRHHDFDGEWSCSGLCKRQTEGLTDGLVVFAHPVLLLENFARFGAIGRANDAVFFH